MVMVNNSYNEKVDLIKYELIKNLLGESDKTLKEQEIYIRLGISSAKDKKILKKILNKLVLEGNITYDKKRGTIKLKTSEYEIGEIVLNGINDFAVECQEGRNSIRSKYLMGSYVGDKVLYSSKDKSIKSVIKSANNPRIFECIRVNDSTEIIPFNTREADDYRFTCDRPIVLTGNEIISATVKKNEEEDYYECNIKEVLGNRTEFNISGKIILAANGIDINFSNKALEEAALVPDHVLESEMEDRVDLRNLQTFTIDSSKKMRTYDDALSFEINKEGNYIVYLHVIDVAHYVKPGSEIFKEARKRSMKIYMHNYGYTHTMLPTNLSCGICSLVQGEDRLSKTISLEFTPSGNLIAYDFFDSVIHIDRNFDSEQAEMVLQAGFDTSNPNCDQKYIKDFILMEKVNSFIKKYLYKTMLSNYPYYEVDNQTDTHKIYDKVMNIGAFQDSMQERAVNIIKFANEQVANHFPTLPFIYKTCKYPTKREIVKLAKSSSAVLSDNMNYAKLDIIEKVLEYHSLPFTKEYRFAVAALLDKEKYIFSTNNKGNFKRGIERYTQINSPARSFVCLVNQLLFDKYNNYFDTDDKSMEELENSLEEICKEYNENDLKYKKLQKLCPSPSERNMKEVGGIAKGVVLDKKGNILIINVKNEGNYHVPLGDNEIEIGDEVVIKLSKTPPGITNHKAKILSYKNNSNNI